MAIDEVKKRESTYKVIQQAGTVLNLFMSFLTGLMRFFLSIQVTTNGDGANKTTVVLAMIFNALTILLQLASGILLLYALMKLSNSVGNVPGAKQKRGSFIAHFSVLVFHLLTLALCQFYIQRG